MTDIKMHPVASSFIKAVGHSGTEENILRVEFHNGHVEQTSGVPVETFEALKGAKSVGKYWHANVKGKYGRAKA